MIGKGKRRSSWAALREAPPAVVLIRWQEMSFVRRVDTQSVILEIVEHVASSERVAGHSFPRPRCYIDLGRRYVYGPAGYLTRLSHARMPVYRIREPEAFNRLLGVAGASPYRA